MARLCDLDGCNEAHRARGLCAKHYNEQNRKPNPKAVFDCSACGAAIVKERARAGRYKSMYCNEACRSEHQWSAIRAGKRQLEPFHPQPALHRLLYRMTATPMRRKPRVFVTGYCITCTHPYSDLYGSKTCSDRCQDQYHAEQKRNARHMRRARQRNAFVANVHRAAIYRRDDHECQLCGEPIDMQARSPHPLSPSIDHIVPLARGGTHEPSNVQAAHLICNAYKSDREYAFEGTPGRGHTV